MEISIKAPHPVDQFVGNKLRKLRHQKKISQEDLAVAVGRTFQQIQKYEKGYNRISASVLWRLAQYLTVPISYFFDGYDTNESNDDCDDNNDSDYYKYDDDNTIVYNQSIITLSDNDEEKQYKNNQTQKILQHFNKITDIQIRDTLISLVYAISNNNKAVYLSNIKQKKK